MTHSKGAERTLVLLRHAKAEQSASLADRDRPLTVRGHADATAAGAWLARQGLRPDVVLCSSARRTRETWQAVSTGLATASTEPAPTGTPRVRYESTAYAAETAALLALLRTTEPDAGTVLLVAHNPGISLLSIALDGAGADREGLRTSGLVVHRFTGAWADLGLTPAPVTHHHTARPRV